MVIKILRSGSANNLASYILRVGHTDLENNAKIITANFLDLENSREDITREFSSYMAGSKLKHTCFHVIVSLPPGESLSENQTHELIEDIEKSLKMGDFPFICVQHKEKEHNHYHIAIGRHSPLHRKVLNDPYSYRVLSQLARSEEKKWGLRQLPDPFSKSISRNDQRKTAIRLKIAESLKVANNYEDFVRELEVLGISVFKQRGIAYSDGLIRVKGSDPNIKFPLSRVESILNSKNQTVPDNAKRKIKPVDVDNDKQAGTPEFILRSESTILESIICDTGVSSPDINQCQSSGSKRSSIDEDEDEWKKKKRKARRH